MPSIKVNSIAKKLGVGFKTIVEYLNEKDDSKRYNVNSKLTTDQLRDVVNEYGNELPKEERTKLLESYTEDSAPTSDAKEKTASEKEVKEKENPKQEKAQQKETEKGPKVLGKVELDKNNEVVRPTPKKEAPKAEAPKKEAPKAEAPKKEASKAEAPKKESPKAEAPKAEAPKKEAPKAETPKKESHKAEAPMKEAPKTEAPKAEAPKKEAPEAISDKAEEPKDDNVKLLTTPEVEIKVVGKIDLSSFDEKKKSSQRKRKRIRGGKVNVEQEGKKQQGREGGKAKQGATKKGQGAQGGAQQGNNRNNNNNKAQQKQGRKAKRKAKQEEKPEITQEDIQKQIRETMAAIQGGRRKSTNQAAKYRKEKREAHRREIDAEEQALQEDKTLQLTEYVTANDLAQMIDIPVNDIIMLCFNLGMMVSINQRLEKDTIDLILDEYGYTPEYVEAQVLDMIETEEDSEEDLKPRAPIVTVMGHVDHGKTSLLDAIRNADVIKTEAGGITQHIGAYSVTLEDGRKITLLDTPGHEAFTAMRARGAKVTDIVIIVVAADDGVMPQTKEALSHASLAGTPIIFAINKIDKPHANPDKIKEELANLNYLVEDWGGKYQSQEISAKKNIGIQELLEKVLLEAEMMDLKANPNKKAVASVLESTMEQGRGYTTKVLVQEGTLHVGDHILAGSNFGRVKALFNERGKNVESVGPAEPVKVLGLNGATQAGEIMNVLDTEQEAREIATRRSQLKREQRERTQHLPSLMDLSRRIAEGNVQELNIIVKGDMDGSVEALSDSIVKLSTDEIKVNVIHKGIGQISESDVILASASDAIIIGFQVRPAQGAKKLAEAEGVEIRTYSIIYDAIDDVTTAMEGMLSPEIKERVTANIEVRETFKVSKVGTIAGCYVVEGKVSRTDKVRVIRDGVVVHTGALGSLKRFKDDAKEVVAGLECGLNIENYNDVQVGDIIEAYEEMEVERKLS
ncbi:translation initiation factor IF-2 [Porphyromonas sp. HMSC077F02]|uniref:translation initiation factor IF-2 n=1 Tax=Porphyromonas sp. HMSC077F02 TaxID=1739529 RepID=UPI0008A60ACE|nr:translation initiation factor IF-2 [Porphyromonas sp. HMSC077F02]OFO55266.1 translation initiation factor IF-2 [Porphyromonas sp. HMSC077F02]